MFKVGELHIVQLTEQKLAPSASFCDGKVLDREDSSSMKHAVHWGEARKLRVRADAEPAHNRTLLLQRALASRCR